MDITIAIGSDHRGFSMKNFIAAQNAIATCCIKWHDIGTYSTDRTDYPQYGAQAAQLVQQKEVDFAILLCGTGVGMTIIANRFPGVYAGLAWNTTIARLNKEDDNCNVLVLPADYITNEEALEIIAAWLSATFKEGRYADRLAMVDEVTS